MAIDFKKLRENAAKNDAAATKDYYDRMGKGIARDLTEGEKADLKTATEKNAGNIRAFGGTGMERQTLTDAEKAARDQNALNIMTDSGLARFMSGFAEGFSPVKDGADYSTPQAQAIKELRETSTEGKVGRMAGMAAQYAIPYAGTEAAAAKVIGKVLPNASKATSLLATNALQDATVGLGLNAMNIYGKENKRGKEALKELAVQEAVDLGVGLAVSKLIGITLKSGKSLTKENIASLSEGEIKEAVEKLPKGEQEQAIKEIRQYRATKPDIDLRTEKKVNDEEFDDFVDTFREAYLPDVEKGVVDTHKDEMRALFADIAKNGQTPKNQKEAARIAEAINSETAYDVFDDTKVITDDMRAVKNELRNRPIAVSDVGKGELGYKNGGSYGSARKAYFGDLRLVDPHLGRKGEKGMPIDTVYADLTERYPGVLPPAENEGDVWSNILDFIGDYKNKTATDDFTTLRILDREQQDAAANALADESVSRPLITETKQRFTGRPKDLREGLKTANAAKQNKADLPTEADTKVQTVKAEPPEAPDIAPTREYREPTTREKVKSWWKEGRKALFDSTAELDEMGKAIDKNYDAAKQAVRTSSGTTNHIFNNDLVGLDGKALTRADGSTYGSYKDLITKIPENELDDFNTYAAHLHNIDRTNQGKPIWLNENGEAKYTIAESQKIVNEMLQKHPDFAQYTADINEWWQAFTHEWLVNTGRMSEDEWKALNAMYPNYVPTYRVDKGGVGGAGLGTGKISTGKGYKKAKGGQSAIKRIEEDFAEQIGSMVKAGRRNGLYTKLVGDLKMYPDDLADFGRISTEAGVPSKEGRRIADELDLTADMTEAEYSSLKKLANGSYSLTAYVDGQPITAVISEDVAKALKLLEDAYDGEGAKALASVGKKITNPMKSAITGLNPIFALSNALRDIPTYLIQSDFPISTKLSSLGKALSGMTGANKEYRAMLEQYKGLGGKDAGYFAQGKGFKADEGGKGLWNATKNVMSWLGEGTETLPRFAEFISELEKGSGNPLEALQKAADVTVNFSRSGYMTKALDGWVLYLNAAAQGLDKFARTAKAHPLKTIAKSAAYITAPYMASVAYNWNNPNYQMLSDRLKQNYLIIPKLDGEKDEDGYAKEFIKIPLNREYGAIAGGSLNALVEALAGDENAMPTLAGTLGTNFLPPSMVTDNVLAPIAVNLKSGTDFAGRQIVPQYLQGEKPINQRDAKTSGVAKAISAIANKVPINSPLDSPMKTDYLIDSYGGYFGELAQKATTGDSLSERAQNALVEPFTSKFSADPRFSSNETQKFYAAKEKATQNKNDSDADMARYKVYTKLSNELNDLSKQERELLALGGDHEAEIKKLREQRNEIAKSAEKLAEEASKVPTFGTLPTNVQKRYDKKSGMTKENWAKMYNTQAQYSSTAAKALALLGEGRTAEQIRSVMSVSDKELARARAMKDAGINANSVQSLYDSTEGKYGRTNKGLIAYEMVGKYDDNYYSGLNISDKKKSAAEKIFNAGWTGEQLNDIIENADRDSNGYTNKEEIANYINGRYGINSPATAKALYELLNSSV